MGNGGERVNHNESGIKVTASYGQEVSSFLNGAVYIPNHVGVGSEFFVKHPELSVAVLPLGTKHLEDHSLLQSISSHAVHDYSVGTSRLEALFDAVPALTLSSELAPQAVYDCLSNDDEFPFDVHTDCSNGIVFSTRSLETEGEARIFFRLTPVLFATDGNKQISYMLSHIMNQPTTNKEFEERYQQFSEAIAAIYASVYKSSVNSPIGLTIEPQEDAEWLIEQKAGEMRRVVSEDQSLSEESTELIPQQSPELKLKDCIGLCPPFVKYTEAILNTVRDPDNARQQGVKVPKTILVHGGVAVGKTRFVEALAGELEAELYVLDSLVALKDLKGSVTEALDVIIEQAHGRSDKHMVLFIDQLEMLVHSGSPLLIEEINRFLGNRADWPSHITVVCATREFTAIPARSGRFDVTLELQLPDAQGRLAILQHIIAQKTVEARRFLFEESVDWKKLISATDGFNYESFVSLIEKVCMLHVGSELRDELISEDELVAVAREFHQKTSAHAVTTRLGFDPDKLKGQVVNDGTKAFIS